MKLKVAGWEHTQHKMITLALGNMEFSAFYYRDRGNTEAHFNCLDWGGLFWTKQKKKATAGKSTAWRRT